MSFSPVSTPITIKPGLDGDVVDGLEFVLHSNVPDTIKTQLDAIMNKSTVKEAVVEKVYITG